MLDLLEGQLKLLTSTFNIYPELDRLYATPENTWVLVRISSQSNKAEILADMIFLRDQMLRLLDEVGEAWRIEIQAHDRKVYMKRESVETQP